MAYDRRGQVTWAVRQMVVIGGPLSLTITNANPGPGLPPVTSEGAAGSGSRVYDLEDYVRTTAYDYGGRPVSRWLAERAGAGVLAHEFGVFVRSAAQLYRAKAAVEKAGLPFKILDERVESTLGHVSISTMHLAKGLEFRAVAVMACDDEVIPSQERIETVGDEGDLQEVYDTERQLLYVACTRARDHLLSRAASPPRSSSTT